jgi:AraC-like DNA-binding protein
MPATSATGYHEAAPTPGLRPWVERVWWRGVDAEPRPGALTILPDGRIDVVWTAASGMLVAGPQTRYGISPLEPPFVAVGARFHPGAAAVVLGIPASELIDEHVALEDVDPGLSRALGGGLATAATPADAVAALAGALAWRCARCEEPDPLVRAAVGWLGRPDARVAALARTAAISERQLQRRFRATVGYGPKTLQRVLRFQRLVGSLGRDGAGLSRHAADAGYADQAHLTRETRELAGVTPVELRDRLAG